MLRLCGHGLYHCAPVDSQVSLARTSTQFEKYVARTVAYTSCVDSGVERVWGSV